MTTQELQTLLETNLAEHKKAVASDPQANPVKLLAYDISKAVEDRSIAFRDIEALVKNLSDKGAIDRINRLRGRAGVDRFKQLSGEITQAAETQAAKGFEAFKSWAEKPGQGIVLTAHPTFSLSRDIRNTLGAIASSKGKALDGLTDTLKTHPYLPKRAPTLIEEHEDTQATLIRIQSALNKLNAVVSGRRGQTFPERVDNRDPAFGGRL